jgi:hypothetical protein
MSKDQQSMQNTPDSCMKLRSVTAYKKGSLRKVKVIEAAMLVLLLWLLQGGLAISFV